MVICNLRPKIGLLFWLFLAGIINCGSASDALSLDPCDIGECDPPPSPIPEQIHLSYGSNSSEMVVIWSTKSSVQSSKVLYSTIRPGSPVQTAVATEVKFTKGNPDGLQYLHRAVMMVSLQILSLFWRGGREGGREPTISSGEN